MFDYEYVTVKNVIVTQLDFRQSFGFVLRVAVGRDWRQQPRDGLCRRAPFFGTFRFRFRFRFKFGAISLHRPPAVCARQLQVHSVLVQQYASGPIRSRHVDSGKKTKKTYQFKEWS